MRGWVQRVCGSTRHKRDGIGRTLQGFANRYVERPRRTERTNRGTLNRGNNRVYVVCDHRATSQIGEDCAAAGKNRLGAPQLSALSILVKTLSN